MVAELIFVGLALFGTAFGTWTDLKNRWVPDWINFLLIGFGLGGHVILSILEWSVWPITYSLIGFSVFFAVGAVMFYGGAWGGGDAKLLAGIGALLPTISINLFNKAPWPFLITLFINIIFVGAILSIIMIGILAIKNHDKIKKEIRQEVFKNKKIIYSAGISLAIPIVASFINPEFKLLLIIWIFAISIIFLIFLTKSVEKTCMLKKIKPAELVEGDWVTGEIKIAEYHYKPKKFGIEKKDIQKLIELENQGKIKEIEVKDGLPYVPSFLIALIISLTYGDIISAILMATLA